MTQEFWYLSRAAGFTAYLLLFFSVAIGIAIGTRFADRFAKRNVLFDLHRFTTILALAFTVFHVYILLGDQYFSYNVWELSIPFLNPYRTIETAVGVFAAYAMVLIVVSFYVRQYIGFRAWRAVHFLTFALFAAAVYHGIAAGTDTTEVWAKGLYMATASVTMMLVLYRVQYRIPDTSTMRAVRLAAGISSVLAGVLLVSTTGLFTASKPATASDFVQTEPATSNAPVSGASVAPAPVAPTATPAPYPFLASFDNDLSGTYQQSQDATGSHLVLDGVATGDVNLAVHVELVQASIVPTPDVESPTEDADKTDNETTETQPKPTVVTNLAELRDPVTGSVLCSGKLTAFSNGRMQLTCDGVGPYSGVSFIVTSRIQADKNGGFIGALSGSMKRIA